MVKRVHTQRPGEWRDIGKHEGRKAVVPRAPTCCKADHKAYVDGYEEGRKERNASERWER